MSLQCAFNLSFVRGTPRVVAGAVFTLLVIVPGSEAVAQRATSSKTQVKRPKCEATSQESRREFDGRDLIADLQGRIAGLNIAERDAAAGGSWGMSIRGRNSIRGNLQPLVFVDHVRVSTLTEAGPLLSFLNPSDIARIDVLRGPAATTLYGTDAASGVIHIFTKRGSGRESTDSEPRVGCPAIP